LLTIVSVRTIRYDTIEEFNVDSTAERGHLNLAHETRNKKVVKKLKQTKGSVHCVRLSV